MRLNPCFESKEVLSQRFNSSCALVVPMNLAGVDGCLLEATLSHQGAPLGHFLWRFGVLLAIDAPARQLLPSLPQAPPAETTPSA